MPNVLFVQGDMPLKILSRYIVTYAAFEGQVPETVIRDVETCSWSVGDVINAGDDGSGAGTVALTIYESAWSLVAITIAKASDTKARLRVAKAR